MKQKKTFKQIIKKIVLTGGPCAGKTTAISIITQQLENAGWKVFICQETATHLLNAGTEISNKGISIKSFQERIILHQIYEEDMIYSIAKQHKHQKVVIILDRAIMDGMAYLSRNEFTKMLKKHKHTIVSIRDKRYDGVFHLVSAASGAESFYTLENNVIRRENVQEAQIIDDKTKNAWIGHPHMWIIDNSTPFKEKIDRLIKEVFTCLGLPVPQKIERKFKIQMPDMKDITIEHQSIDIQQHYLKGHGPKKHERIRRRGKQGSHTYYHTTKRYIKKGTKIELEEKISKKRYYDLLNIADQKLFPIIKERICFLWENQYFEMDIFKKNLKGLCILEIEVGSKKQKVKLPPWIKVIQEVTDNKNYNNYELATH